MKTYQQLKSEHQTAYDKIMEKHRVFWAFSNSQFKEGMKKIGHKKGEKLCSIGMGGYMPLASNKPMFEELRAEDKRHKAELKKLKEEKEGAIIYELANHECFYTGNITPVLEHFKGIYTPAAIKQVFKKEAAKNVLSY
jgi:hypothetical protein